jgi:hypothetical protein
VDRSALITSTNGSRSHKNELIDIAITDNYSKGVNKRAALNLRRGNIGIKISLYIRVDTRPVVTFCKRISYIFDPSFVMF